MQDPKRASRWVLVTNHIPVYTLKVAKKPTLSIGKIEHNYLNHIFKYPSKVEWEDCEITLVDPVDPDAAATVVDIISASGYHPLRDENDFATISKKDAVAALGQVKLMQVDAEGQPVETWSLANAWISKVDFGELSYESDDLTEIKLTLTFDWASLKRGPNARSNYGRSGTQKQLLGGLENIEQDLGAEEYWVVPEA
jgi:hypothetical protein